jgi:protein-L-isoaspartate O-methyltransferase
VNINETILPDRYAALLSRCRTSAALIDISADDTVLEIGTGLGYQAAILAQLARKVYSIEIIEELGRQAPVIG